MCPKPVNPMSAHADNDSGSGRAVPAAFPRRRAEPDGVSSRRSSVPTIGAAQRPVLTLGGNVSAAQLPGRAQRRRPSMTATSSAAVPPAASHEMAVRAGNGGSPRQYSVPGMTAGSPPTMIGMR